MTRPHIDKPQWSSEFSWNGVAAVVALLTFLVGGAGFLWAMSSTWAVAQTDIEAIKRAHNELRVTVEVQQEKVDEKIQRLQEGTERRLEVIHADVQAIKNLLIADRRRDK